MKVGKLEHNYIQTIVPTHRPWLRRANSSRNVNNLIQIPLMRTIIPGKKSSTKFAVLNARSMVRKSTLLCDLIMSKKLDILAITETWLNGSDLDSHCITDIRNTLPNYNFIHLPRKDRKGGGIAVVIRDGFKVTENTQLSVNSFEYLDLLVSYKNDNIRLVTVYRPPPNNKNKFTVDIFRDEFSSLVEVLTLSQQPLIICGDFNFHVDDSTNPDAVKFFKFFGIYGFKI